MSIDNLIQSESLGVLENKFLFRFVNPSNFGNIHVFIVLLILFITTSIY